jgi:hypothetical protein
MFKLNEKEYDESKISKEGQIALSRLQQIQTDQNKIRVKFDHNEILIKHYMDILQEEIQSNAKVDNK